MIKKAAFRIKQGLKMMLQNRVLPCVYGFWRLVYRRRKTKGIVFADAHNDTLPQSMQNMYDALRQKGYDVSLEISDYGKMSQFRSAWAAIKFMRIYAKSRYIFICDNFLPIASCKKDDCTTVVQLWHSCGLLKKMGYTTGEDIPANYKGEVYRNYDLVTVSAPCCVEPLTESMHQKPGVVQALGVSRTDRYFDRQWLAECRETFYRQYPQARNKNIILWAPTFRGNAGDPHQIGMEAVERLARELGNDYFVIRKMHPHVDAKYHLSNCDIPTERLLPVTDLMITDYSSVVCDFMLFQKPYVMFAPDLAEYEEKRGFYVPYSTYSPYVVTEEGQLKDQVIAALESDETAWMEKNRAYHMAFCDGHATERILDYLGL